MDKLQPHFSTSIPTLLDKDKGHLEGPFCSSISTFGFGGGVLLDIVFTALCSVLIRTKPETACYRTAVSTLYDSYRVLYSILRPIAVVQYCVN